MKATFPLLVLFSFLFPFHALGLETKTIHVEWTYSGKASAYNLYKDGQQVCSTNNPSTLKMDCLVQIEDAPMTFTLTAIDSSGTEGPKSPPYIFAPNFYANNAASVPAAEPPLTNPAPTIEIPPAAPQPPVEIPFTSPVPTVEVPSTNPVPSVEIPPALPQPSAEIPFFKSLPEDQNHFTFNTELLNLPMHSEITLDLPHQSRYAIIFERLWHHNDTTKTWVGYLKQYGKSHRVFVTIRGDEISGTINTPDGPLKITTSSSGTNFADERFIDLIPVSFGDDEMIPSLQNGNILQPSALPLMEQGQSSANTVIDLMILYTPGMLDKYPGEQLELHLATLITKTNQAFYDSEVNITVRLVHSREVLYSETNDMNIALNDLTAGRNGFSNVKDIRADYGADLVQLIRPFDSINHSGCGMAWLNGTWQDIRLDANTGYSVVGDGRDGPYYCSDYIMAHELGHNLGSAHDRYNSASEGAYPYSYGYGIAGQFGTIMSYISPETPFFSNPDIWECNSMPCGIDETASNAANNALSLNNTKDAVAAFSQTVALSNLYYPHIASNNSWETEICLINTSATSTTDGELIAYNKSGQEVSSRLPIILAPKAREEIKIASHFNQAEQIKYLVFQSQSSALVGYMKFFIEGSYRAAIPAVTDINLNEIGIPHVASNSWWWTGISLVNTKSTAMMVTIEFDDGSVRTLSFTGGEHKAFLIKDLFGGQSQPEVHSGVIKNATGLIGLELFGSSLNSADHYLGGIPLKNATTYQLYYPHITSSSNWWTGIVAYNPSQSPINVTIRPYSASGKALPEKLISMQGHEKYIGTFAQLDFPKETAWFGLRGSSALTGFELFGTNNGNQLAGLSATNLSSKSGVLTKTEGDGWTGVVFVNTASMATVVELFAYNDSGTLIASSLLALGPYSKKTQYAEALFGQDISAATHITYSSTQRLVSFQLNGSYDDMMLDALPGM